MRGTPLIIALIAALALTGGVVFASVTGVITGLPGPAQLVETFAARHGGGGTSLRAAGPGAGPVPSPAPASAAPADAPVEQAVVPVLVYHNFASSYPGAPMSRDYDITSAEFDAEMSWLAEQGYRSISMSTLADAFEGKTALPDKPVIITLDDGRESQYAFAVPSLVRHGLVATAYVFTNAIGRPGYYTWDQLRTMESEGMEIGDHTRYHPYLTRSSDADLIAEIDGSKTTLEAGLGHPVDTFAYPFGLYDDRVVAAVKAAGFRTGRTLRHGTMQHAGEALVLKAHIMTGDLSYLKAVMARSD